MGTPLYANTDPPRADLDFLVRNLDIDTVRCKRLMRQLLEQDDEAFFRDAMRVLNEHSQTRGAQQVLALLAERGLLPTVLCAPGVTRERALELARAASSVVPSTDILLARGLLEILELPESTEAFHKITRLIDILAEISDASRLFPCMMRLMRHSNPHIRSKAVLMVGRHSRSVQWVRPRLSDADPRIRANALETLWDVDTTDARDILAELLHDPNNRVAGNAMLGLYRLGETSVISEILAMAAHESALFRSTAAWVMGETGDPRFTDVLAALLREPHAVRKRAFHALGRIRALATPGAQSPPYRLGARLTETSNGLYRVAVAVAGQSGWTVPELLPTQFIVSEDGRPVNCYRVAERPVSETIFVVFLMPVNGLDFWRQAALSCAPWKRASDLWACDFYEGAVANEGGAKPDPPIFHNSLDAIRGELHRVRLRFESPDLWRSIRRFADIEAGAVVGKPQMIVFRESTSAALPDDLLAAIAAAQATLHVISIGPDRILEDLCRKADGTFTCIETVDQAPDAAIRTYLQQLPQYELSWTPLEPAARHLKIRLHGSATGEISLPLV